MPEIDNLDDAIRDAVEKNPPPPDAALEELLGKKPDEEKPADKKPVEKTEEEKPEDQHESDEGTEEIDADSTEVKNALVFYRALNDPTQRGDLVKTLAQVSGYDLTKKEQATQLNKDIKSILREKLGDNYEILSGDKLAEAFHEALELKVKEAVEPALAKISKAEVAENNRKADSAMTDFFKRNDISKDQQEAVSKKLFEKMQVMPAGPNSDVNSYLDDLYFLTHRDRVATKTVKNTVEKIKENAKERNSSGEGTGNEDRIKRGSAMPSLDEAVRAAFRNERLS